MKWILQPLLLPEKGLHHSVVAVLGAFLAGYFLSPIFGLETINDAITIPTMLVTLLEAVILLAIVNLIRRRR